MHPVIAKTFGGLSVQYYVRQFLFGLIFTAMMMMIMMQSEQAVPLGIIVTVVCHLILGRSLCQHATRTRKVMQQGFPIVRSRAKRASGWLAHPPRDTLMILVPSSGSRPSPG